jgi:peptidoglycan/LPS O-acetylase OafA/YrhL
MNLHSGTAPAGGASAERKSFYKPELDALRFAAFAGVLVHHGPYAPGLAEVVIMLGGFGLSMFFLLSAYLITELLLRERAQTGTVAWSLFFARRALRIWPLYYTSLAVAILIGLANPHFPVNGVGAAGMSFFIVNWVLGGAHLGFAGSLWSISVEEQFYLIWPPIVRAGGKRLVLIASIVFVVGAGVWLWVFAGKGWQLWYDTPVEFLFFGAGAVVALATRGEARARSCTSRAAILIAGLLLLVAGARIGGIGTAGIIGLTHARLYFGYGAAVAGCTAILVGFLGMRHVPRALIYLGKISYGLYVFHEGALFLAQWSTAPLKLLPASAVHMLAVDTLALLICIPSAHLSYQYFEKPFLKLKQRFEVVESRSG